MGDERTVLRDALGRIAQTLHDAHELAAGEAALDSIAKLLGMPWPCYGTPELKHPGSPILYATWRHMMDGGGNFRANFGVETTPAIHYPSATDSDPLSA